MALIASTTVGFMSRMTSLDDHNSLTGVDFYTTCFIFVWSAVIATVLQLVLMFHVAGMTFELHFILGAVTFALPVTQIASGQQPVSFVQWVGMCIIPVTLGLYVYTQLTQTEIEPEVGVFFTCPRCELAERAALTHTADVKEDNGATKSFEGCV
jgi:hypothetical protein